MPALVPATNICRAASCWRPLCNAAVARRISWIGRFDFRLVWSGCRDARIALGAVDATAIRAHAAESVLNGRQPSPAAFAEAGKLSAQACHPISDVRASADYRKRLVAVLTARALARCLALIEEAA